MVHWAYAAGVAARYGLGAAALYNMAFRRRFRRRPFRQSILGKRKRGFTPNFGRKRARFMSGRNGSFVGRRFQSSTAERPFLLDNRFRSRKLSKRRWRKVLWRDTLAQTHYRSVADIGVSLGLSSATATSPVNFEPMLTNAFAGLTDTAPFWTAGGGLQPNETGAALPLFGDNDIVLRGGYSRLQFSPNDTVVLPIRVKVWVVRAVQNPDLAKITAITTGNQAADWDPTLVPEFVQDVGRVVLAKETLLLPGARPFEMVWKLNVQKIDQAVWQGKVGPPIEPPGGRFYWMWQLQPTNTTAATGQLVAVLKGHNLSFSADTV